MNSFYGNLKNNSRASFIFDKVYPSRTDMEAALKEEFLGASTNNHQLGDGVWVNRYVLVSYNYQQNGDYTVSQNDRYEMKNEYIPVNTEGFTYEKDRYYYQDNDKYILDTNETATEDRAYYELITSMVENQTYMENRNKDIKNFGAHYDKTVWMKIYSNQEEKYIQVGALNAAAPAFEIVPDAPSAADGNPHIDYYHSGDLNYVYHTPGNWDIILNHYSGVATEYATDNLEPEKTKEDYYYEDLIEQDSKDEYPYVNSKGFNLETRHYDRIRKDDIKFTEVKSGKQYPIHIYLPIELTIDTYRPNLFYTYDNTTKKYNISQAAFNVENHYYTLAQGKFLQANITASSYAQNKFYYANGESYILDTSASFTEDRAYYRFVFSNETSAQEDTKRLDIELPSIGNAISDVYDSIFGRPLNDPNLTGLKYTEKPVPEIFKDSIPDSKPEGLEYCEVIINGDTYYITQPELDGNGLKYIANPIPNDIPTSQPSDGDGIEYIPVHPNTPDNTTTYYLTPGQLNGLNGLKYIADRQDYSYPIEPSEGLIKVLIKGQVYYLTQTEFDNLANSYDAQNHPIPVFYAEGDPIVSDTYDAEDYPTPIFYKMDDSPIQDNYDDEHPLIIILNNTDPSNGYPNGIKYTTNPPHYLESNTPFQDYYDDAHPWQCSINGKYYYLSNNEWENELWTEYSPEHPIPVYNIANDKERPYTPEQLYNFLDIEPYNNVTPSDPVSMAWGVEELKKYISELRYLSHGELDGDFDPLLYNGNGLQSDWYVDEPTAFGYIYNKPTVITNYTAFSTTAAPETLDGKYRYMRDISDRYHVPYFFEGIVSSATFSSGIDQQTQLSTTKTVGTFTYKKRNGTSVDSIELQAQNADKIFELEQIESEYRFSLSSTASLVTPLSTTVSVYRKVAFSTSKPYENNIYYYLNGGNYTLSTTGYDKNTKYYESSVGYNIAPATITSPFIAYGGRIITSLGVTENFIWGENETKNYDNLVKKLNAPGGYELVACMNYKPEVVDLVTPRDGKFHIFDTIEQQDYALAIEKIWQEVPVEDCMISMTYVNEYDTNSYIPYVTVDEYYDKIGNMEINPAESVTVLDSTLNNLSNKVNGLLTDTADLENRIGTANPSTGLFASVADLENRVGNPDNPQTENNEATGLYADVIELEDNIEQLQTDVGSIDSESGLLFDVDNLKSDVGSIDSESGLLFDVNNLKNDVGSTTSSGLLFDVNNLKNDVGSITSESGLLFDVADLKNRVGNPDDPQTENNEATGLYADVMNLEDRVGIPTTTSNAATGLFADVEELEDRVGNPDDPNTENNNEATGLYADVQQLENAIGSTATTGLYYDVHELQVQVASSTADALSNRINALQNVVLGNEMNPEDYDVMNTKSINERISSYQESTPITLNLTDGKNSDIQFYIIEESAGGE